jgi:hypothetical protein
MLVWRNAVLSREDFVFTIGYDGPAAVVDGQAKRRYGSLSTRQLAELGLFRAAWSSAVYSGDKAEMDTVLELYSKTAGSSYAADSSPDRLFGVFPVEVKRAIVL